MTSDFADIKFDFSGKTAIITGGSKGIGKDVADSLVESGATVYNFSRSKPQNKSVKHFPCDISREDEVLGAIAKLDEVERIDFFIHVAGANNCEPINNLSAEDWKNVLSINLGSYFLFTRYISERMKENNFGKIICVSSIAGRSKSVVSGVHYTASKAGLIGFTRQLSQELAPFNIKVNVVCPSQTMTDMLRESMTKEQISQLENKIPLGRIASPTEITQPILFLCSSGASYITGAAIDINGGQL